jgi:polar amino acid transport system substrate-binding protein
MMRVLRLFVIASLCYSAPALAGAICPSVTRVGLSDLGYTAYREHGRIGGISVDIANEMARRTGCKFEFSWYPRQRLFVELAAGNIDMTMASLRLPERDAHARYLPYAYLQYDLVLAAAPTRSYASLAEFVEQGKGKLNVTRGIAYDAAIETQLARLAAAGRLEVVNDFETVFAKLEMGRADGTLATAPIYGKYLKSGKLQTSAVVITLPEAAPRFTGIYLAKSTISPAVRDRYAIALKAMVTDQTIRTIYARYFDEATLKRMIRQGQGPLLAALSAPDD